MKKVILLLIAIFMLIFTTKEVHASELDIVDTKNHTYTYTEFAEDVFLLGALHPEKMSVSSLGKSVDGRDIYQIILGNKDAKNAIIVQGTIHGREWMNSWMLMESLEMCLNNWNQLAPCGKTYGEVFQNCCIYLIPMVNPDGVTLSQYGLAGLQNPNLIANCLWMPGANRPALWKANANGVDLNRQFSVGWNTKIDTVIPSSENYNGQKPFTEPEAVAVKKALDQRSFTAGVVFHSQGNEIYWDLGQQGALRERVAILAMHCKNITGYRFGTISPVKGLEYNYMNFEKNIPTVCIETGTVPCPLPYSQWKKVWKANGMVMPVLAGCYQ